MTVYHKAKEYDVIACLKKQGFAVIEHYGDRKKHKGDILAVYKDVCYRIDVKSTRRDINGKVFFNKDWLYKLSEECFENFSDDGMTEPMIIITKYRKQVKYVMVFHYHQEAKTVIDKNTKTFTIDAKMLDDGVIVDDVYITTLTTFIKELDNA